MVRSVADQLAGRAGLAAGATSPGLRTALCAIAQSNHLSIRLDRLDAHQFRDTSNRSAGPVRMVKLPEPVLQAMELDRSGGGEPAHISL